MIAKLSRKDIKMLESSAKSDVSKCVLEEYLNAHKKAETAWKVFRDSLVLSEGSGEDSASKEMKSEKKRKFKTGDKVRVLSEIGYVESGTLEEGSLTEVVYYKEDDNEFLFPYYNPVGVRNLMGEVVHCEESALELATEQEKTPNELRAEIIQRAKEFVEEYADYPLLDSVIQISEQRNKRKIVASIVSIKNMQFMMKEVVVKTHPNDVYNFHIGKAIAIGRLLGKDVTEFENAVQPTEPVIGHVVNGNENLGFYRPDHKFTLTSKQGCDSFYYAEWRERDPESLGDYIYSTQIGTIIDDTNAQYGVGDE